MKIFQLKISTLLASIVMLLGVVIMSCSDRDNNKTVEDLITNMKMSPEVLNQTVWKGEVFRYFNGSMRRTFQANLFFRSDKEVISTTIYEGSQSRYRTMYKASGKLLSINENGSEVFGDWLLIEVGKDKIVLKQNPEDEKNYSIMTLSRIYNQDHKLSSDQISETVWKGSFTQYNDDIADLTQNVNLFFKSDKVEFLITPINGPQFGSTVEYTANKNLISILTGISPQLGGDWLIFEKSKDKMVLQKGFGDSKFRYIMTLTRTD
ncbi:hypothetical protein [Elizabethkingia anophelis]|uniref:hypothetical protein n=1 Tax=Elizabethkingia anophelis TaxID=1117645 RepID=UPI00099A4692|nr:hypothetical protein [Elizabethkingia anophelis]MBE9392228.1 hypothetical protein [Elizabethkingia anophelis]MBE9406834.1 hypothetical protein [Elizabethkingia anophelis]OPC51842.1 hypothetical protein BAY06_04900 [Elizabethkingia anophelis]